MVIYAKEKKERALGEKLFLKAYRCNSPKCAMLRRPHRPGVHGKRRQSTSDFASQLKAKQKFKLSYGVNESQLKTIFEEAARGSSATGEQIIEMLERRLDNALYRSGIAPSRIVSRHIITRGHVQVNGRRTVSPSFLVSAGDMVSVRPESRAKGMFRDIKERFVPTSVPSWLETDIDKLEAKVVASPSKIEPMFDISAVVEYFSKHS